MMIRQFIDKILVMLLYDNNNIFALFVHTERTGGIRFYIQKKLLYSVTYGCNHFLHFLSTAGEGDNVMVVSVRLFIHPSVNTLTDEPFNL